MAAVVRAAAANGTAIEINADWRRLDLKGEHARLALQAGVTLAVNTDAHSTTGFNQMRYGVMTARRGGAGRSSVLNTFTLAALRKRIAAKGG